MSMQTISMQTPCARRSISKLKNRNDFWSVFQPQQIMSPSVSVHMYRTFNPADYTSESAKRRAQTHDTGERLLYIPKVQALLKYWCQEWKHRRAGLTAPVLYSVWILIWNTFANSLWAAEVGCVNLLPESASGPFLGAWQNPLDDWAAEDWNEDVSVWACREGLASSYRPDAHHVDHCVTAAAAE